MRERFFITISVFLILLGVELVIIFNTNPQTSSSITKVFLFIFGAGAFSCLIFLLSLISFKILKKQSDNDTFRNAYRRSALIAIFIAGLGAFSALNVINFISVLSFFLALFLIEIFLSMQRKSPKL